MLPASSGQRTRETSILPHTRSLEHVRFAEALVGGDGSTGFSLPFRQDLKQELGAAPVQFHVAELVAEQVNAAVAGDGLDKLLVVGGFDQLVDELGGQGVADR